MKFEVKVVLQYKGNSTFVAKEIYSRIIEADSYKDADAKAKITVNSIISNKSGYYVEEFYLLEKT